MSASSASTPFPLSALCKAASLASPQFAGSDEKLTYLRSLDGKTQLIRQCLLSGLAEVVTAEHAPAGSIGYGGGAYSCQAHGVAYASTDRRLRFLDWDHGQEQVLSPAYKGLTQPTLSPCGRFVAYIAEDGERCRVYVVARTGEGSTISLSQGRGSWFAFNPSFSPDGAYLSWIEWDSHAMPWDESRLVVARLGRPCREASHAHELVPESYHTLAAPGVSFAAPCFSPDSRYLAYLQDQGAWRALWVTDAAATSMGEQLSVGPGEVGCPDWVPGMSHIAWRPDSQELFGLRYFESRTTLFSVQWPERSLSEWQLPHSHIEAFCLGKQRLAYLGSAPDTPTELVTLDFPLNRQHAATGAALQRAPLCVRATSRVGTLPRGLQSVAQFCRWPTAGGSEDAYGLFYAAQGSAASPKPRPLIVHIHGGPTSQSLQGWRPEAHYFTSRGYHYLSVNHRGSSGFGRQYQDRQKKQWGVVDIEDARAGAQALIDRGYAAADQVAIMGASAGGYTVLRALSAQPDFWAAGIALYGISMLYELEANCHRFERPYNQALIGHLPEAGSAWEERSPLTQAAAIKAPLLLFHGQDDRAVPHEQSAALAAALQSRGAICQFISYPGEGHGFKREENKRTTYRTALAFLHKHVVCKQGYGVPAAATPTP